MSTVDVAKRIAEWKAKPVALTRKQKEAAREELKRLSEEHAPKVIETLAGFVKDRKIPASSRVAAGNLLLERYAGKSAKPNEEDRPEDSYSRMSESQLISTICESIWGLSSQARGAIAEALVMAEQGIRPDFDAMRRDLEEEAAEIAKMEAAQAPKPKRVPRR